MLSEQTQKIIIDLPKSDLVSVPICKCGKNLRCDEYIGHYRGLCEWLKLQNITEKEKGEIRCFLFDHMCLNACCRMILMCHYDPFSLMKLS